MKQRRFGRTGWMVSEISYGMWGVGGWTGSNDDESMQALQRAVDLGCNFFDTAWAYGAGKSEGLLGELVRANQGKKLYTATKIPPKNLKWPSRREYLLEDCFPPDHIQQYVESSLNFFLHAENITSRLSRAYRSMKETLTGTLTRESRWPEGDWRNTYFVPENLHASVDRAEALKPLIPPGMTMPDMALRFILAEPTVSTIIPGMRRIKHVETNLAASDASPLEASLLKELEKHCWDRRPTQWSQ